MELANYGKRLDDHWRGICSASQISAPGHSDVGLSVARITGGPNFGFVDPVRHRTAMRFSLELIDYQRGDLWLDGRNTPQIDLKRNNSVLSTYVTRSKLDWRTRSTPSIFTSPTAISMRSVWRQAVRLLAISISSVATASSTRRCCIWEWR